MATIFVSAVDGNNADDGSTWALAKQTTAGALAIAAAGDVILVDNAGTFTANAAISWTPPAGGVSVISVNRAGGDVWATGATENCGATASAFSIEGAAGSSMFVYGMNLGSGTTANSTADIALLPTNAVSSRLEMRSCTLDIKNTSLNAEIRIGPATTNTGRSLDVRLDGCTLIASGSRAGSLVGLQKARAEIINPTISCTGATKPASLFKMLAASDPAELFVRDGDLTGYAVSGGAYFDVTNWTCATAILENLKLSSTPAMVSGTWPGGFGAITLRNCDSGDTINTFEYRNAYGTLTENSSIYAASGAEFSAAGVSWEIVTTASCDEYHPFELPLLSFWNTVTSAQTATVEFVKDGATDLTDREIWLELSYAASASFPNYTAANDRNTNPFTGTAADQPNSSVSWTGTGGFANEDKQSLDVAFTAAEVGLLTGRVFVAKASTTLYVSPVLTGLGGSGDVVWTDDVTHQLPASGGLLAHPGMRGGFV